MQNHSHIVIAGGCFWGLEHLLKKVHGVIDTEVGYCGGRNDNPTYEYHPGHAEAILVTYDTTQLTLSTLLDHFFRYHNPTTKNRQGNDIGSSYRSAIFYKDEVERGTAEEMIERVNESARWDDPVVTTLEPLTRFWPAEEYHQDYLEKNPGGYTCHIEYFDTPYAG